MIIKLAIVGSRTFDDYELMRREVRELLPLIAQTGDEIMIISGGANGADTLAVDLADELGLDVKVFNPNWDKYGKAAGVIRNELIVNECNFLIAFWDGESHGTKHSVDMARRLGKLSKVVRF